MAAVERLEQEGWSLRFYAADDPEARARLGEAARSAIHGEIVRPVRRSRHATTYRMRLQLGEARRVVFIKLYDPPRWRALARHLLRGSRARRAVVGSMRMRAAGLAAPEVLMLGERGLRGGAMLMTAAIDGDVLPRFLEGADRKTRRATLDVLGREVGRMHRAGVIHGDLTPFNIFARRGEPVALVFLDHERTRRAPRVNRRRAELRNLVQLGHFPFAGISRTDQMRVFRAWAQGRGLGDGRGIRRRAWRMLKRRMARDLTRFGAAAVARSSHTGGV